MGSCSGNVKEHQNSDCHSEAIIDFIKMGSLMSILGLGGGSGNSGSSGYNSVLECCDGVVDPLTLLAVLGAIIGLTFFLRQAIIDKVVGRKRRKREINSVSQMYNLLALENDDSKRHELYKSLFQIVSRMFEGDNFFQMAFAGRLLLITKIGTGYILL